jgi:short-chain Z-isoprenyl diphosphate synthase
LYFLQEYDMLMDMFLARLLGDSWLIRKYENRLERAVRKGGALPKHLGVILDGNRRYARMRGLASREGHQHGAKNIRSLIAWCNALHIPAITLWAFSVQNFSRSAEEVADLMELFTKQAQAMMTDADLEREHIRVRFIGRKTMLPQDLQDAMRALEEHTASRTGMLVQIALAYGGREEIVDATRAYLLQQEANGVTLTHAREALGEQSLSGAMYSANVPDPDLIIRTSGEIRLSGFLLWQAAYSEYYFSRVHWPAWKKYHLLRALRAYQIRKRRFGI